MKRNRMVLIVCLFITLCLSVKAWATCFFIGDQYYCVPASYIQSSDINWTNVKNMEIQKAGVNWSSVNTQDIQKSGINWTSINAQEIQKTGINWMSINGYLDGRTLKARSSVSGGVNWE